MQRLELRNPFPGAVCYLLSETDSTQDEAKRLALSAGFPPGSLIAAEGQRAGRGRFPERSWSSEPGRNLLFTLYLEPQSATALPIRIGGAMLSAVELYARSVGAAFPRPPELKWPNDLMFGERKAAGVLCEGGASGVFAGIGLNCNQRVFPSGLRTEATSLALELGREVERWTLLERILESVAVALEDPEWRTKIEAVLWRKGRPARFYPGTSASASSPDSAFLEGQPEGVDETGALLFRERGQESVRAMASGELRAAT